MTTLCSGSIACYLSLSLLLLPAFSFKNCFPPFLYPKLYFSYYTRNSENIPQKNPVELRLTKEDRMKRDFTVNQVDRLFGFYTLAQFALFTLYFT